MYPNALPRFIKVKSDGFASAYYIRDTITHEEFPITPDVVIKRFNDLHEEKEFWKHATIQNDNENVILKEELSNMVSQGAVPSLAFRTYTELKAKRVKEAFRDGLRIMENGDDKMVEYINEKKVANKKFKKFRKIPVEIEAYQTTEEVFIETKEGTMKADVGDWIIRGVKGELYPCKPDIFEMTYESGGDDEV